MQMLFIVLTSSLIWAGEKWDFIEPENTSIQVILVPSKDTISATDTLTIRVIIQNTGGFNLILADRWDNYNVSFSYTDENGKDIGYLGDENGPHLFLVRNPRPSSLILGWDQFWGFNLVFLGKTFPKPGTYYIQVTYWGTSPELIKHLIENGHIKRSTIDAPMNKYWHGEVKSNKIKIVVKKE